MIHFNVLVSFVLSLLLTASLAFGQTCGVSVCGETLEAFVARVARQVIGPSAPSPPGSLPAYVKPTMLDFTQFGGAPFGDSTSIRLGGGFSHDNKLAPHHNLYCSRSEGVGGGRTQCLFTDTFNAVGYLAHGIFTVPSEVQPLIQAFVKNRAPDSYLAASYVEGRLETGSNDQSSVVGQELTVVNTTRDRGFQLNPLHMLSSLRLTAGNGADWGCKQASCFPVDHGLELYPNGTRFYVGAFFGGGSTIERDILSLTDARTSIEILGRHEVGLDLSGTFTHSPIRIRAFAGGGKRLLWIDNEGYLTVQ